MSLLPITLFGDKILRKKAEKVEEVDIPTVQLIRDMFDSMRNANGVGLAANQVGADKQIIVIDISVIDGYEDLKPLVIINPEIIERSEEKVYIEEGCLSIPDIRAEVERPKAVKLKYFDSNMEEHILEADDFLARVIQHEYDHLQGVLFTDLIEESIQKKIKRSLLKIKNRKVEFEYPVSETVDYELKSV